MGQKTEWMPTSRVITIIIDADGIRGYHEDRSLPKGGGIGRKEHKVLPHILLAELPELVRALVKEWQQGYLK